jgi:hypothetical protein
MNGTININKRKTAQYTRFIDLLFALAALFVAFIKSEWFAVFFFGGSLFYLFGSVGAAETGSITFGVCLLRGSIVAVCNIAILNLHRERHHSDSSRSGK